MYILLHGIVGFMSEVFRVMRRGHVSCCPMVGVVDEVRSIVAIRLQSMIVTVRMRRGAAPGILWRYYHLFRVIHVRSPCFACPRTAEQPTRNGDVADVGYLVKGHQTVERGLTEVCREMPFTRDVMMSVFWKRYMYTVGLFDKAFCLYSRI